MKVDSNKRKSERLFCQVPVEDKKGTTDANMLVVDICRGGIGLISNRSVSIDEKMVVELALQAEEDPLLVMGQVKWIQRSEAGFYRVGMKFTKDLAIGSKSRLKKYFS